MASKAANTAEVTETREEAAEAPLLDTLAAAIKKMLARGKERLDTAAAEVGERALAITCEALRPPGPPRLAQGGAPGRMATDGISPASDPRV